MGRDTLRSVIDNPFREVLSRHAGPLVRLYGALGLTPNG